VESRVIIRLALVRNGGAHFTLEHVDLPGKDVAESHSKGWTSSLRKLKRLAVS